MNLNEEDQAFINEKQKMINCFIEGVILKRTGKGEKREDNSENELA